MRVKHSRTGFKQSAVSSQQSAVSSRRQPLTSHLSPLTSHLSLPFPFPAGAPQGRPRLFDDFRGAKDDQRHDEHGARDDLLFLRRHAGEAQAVLDEGKHQERYEDSAHCAGSSKDVYAPEDNGGYHRKFESDGRI